MAENPYIQAVVDDEAVTEVARLARIIWNEHFPAVIGQAQVDYMVANYQSAAAIAQQIAEGLAYYLIGPSREPVGYCACAPEADGSLFLNKLYVLQAQRRRGWARQALAFMEDWCRQQGLHRIWLRCNKDNTAAIAAYERMGFFCTGTLVSDIGAGFMMDDVTMEKPVPEST